MAVVNLESGDTLDTSAIPVSDADETIACVAGLPVQLAPLEGLDAEADPADFLPEIESYYREIFRLGKKKPVAPVTFRIAGRIEDTAYWIFSTDSPRGESLYVLVVRRGPSTEMFSAEQNASWRDAATGEIQDRVLSPAQAALLDYAAPDL